MSKRKKTFFDSSLLNNNRTYLQYVERLTEIAVSRFKWNNLPHTMNARFMEWSLFTHGNCTLFNDDVIGYLNLPIIINSSFDVYGEPIHRKAYSPYTDYTCDINRYNSVIVWNNMIKTNSVLDIENFSLRLYNLDRIVDVNSNTQKSPFIIECDEKLRLTMLNMFKEIDGNSPVVFGRKGLTADSIKVLNLNTNYIADKIYELKTKIWNEALTYLGISNMQVEKRERLITDEVMRSQGGAFACRRSGLRMREIACEQFNKMFGENISVEFDESIEKESLKLYRGELGE